MNNYFILFGSIVFFLYHFAAFNYSQKILVNTKRNPIKYLTAIAINYILIVMFYYFQLNEFYLMIGYFLVLAIEFKVYFKSPTEKIIFGTVCFALNLMCVRMLIMSVYSAYYHVSIYQVVTSVPVNILCTFVAFALGLLYLTLFEMFVKIDILFMVHTIGDNASFVNKLLCSIYIYLIIIINLYYVRDNVAESILHWYLIKVAICGLAGFVVSIGYAIFMAKLQDLKQQSEEVLEEIIQAEEVHKELLDIAYIDNLTGCYKRDWTMQELQKRIDEKLDFTIVFIDLDGLKYVNDNFGHQEGDLYLLIVSKLLKDFFPGMAVCRLGGDEFVVIADGKDYKSCQSITKTLRGELNNLSRSNDKYTMSFSYGITTFEDGMTCEALLNKADKKMYEFKRVNKKARN